MRIIGELISLGCRLFIAGLFLYAAHDKVWAPAAFALDTARYDILPLELVNSFSVGLAWLELILGIFMLIGLMVRAAAFWASMLLMLFTGLMIYAGFTGAGFDCGCFPGQAGHAAGLDAALRDFLFLLPALWLWCLPGAWLQFYTPKKEGLW